MALSLLQGHDVSDLCIGKPALSSLPPSATAADALAALRCAAGGDAAAAAIAVRELQGGAVVGRVRMVDVLLFLCADGNLAAPAAALGAPVAALLAGRGGAPSVRRVEPKASVLEAVDAFLDGADSLVVPIRAASAARRQEGEGGGELCWVTVEDVVRFFLGSISLFSPTASQSVSALGIVRPAALAVAARDRALSAVPLLRAAAAAHTSVAVVLPSAAPGARRLAGEIAPSALAACGVSVAAAVAALPAGDLGAFLDCCRSPPESALRAVRSRLRRRNLLGMLQLLDGDAASPPSPSTTSSSSSGSSSSSSSSDDEDAKNYRSSSSNSLRSYSARMGRRAEEAVVCHPESSLVAVMARATAHRVTHVWVVDEDCMLLGVVGFVDVLRVLREHLR